MGYGPAVDDIVAERLGPGVYSVTGPTTCQYGKALDDIQSKIHLVSSLSLSPPLYFPDPSDPAPFRPTLPSECCRATFGLVPCTSLLFFYLDCRCGVDRPTLKKYQGEKVDKPLPVPWPDVIRLFIQPFIPEQSGKGGSHRSGPPPTSPFFSVLLS